MKSEKATSTIIFLGIIIVAIFTGVVTYNLLPKNEESNFHYAKTTQDMNAKIDMVKIDHHHLEFITSGDAIQYCVKTTRSTPTLNSLCWKNVENNHGDIAVFEYKTYYIWIKDKDGNISIPQSINKKN